MNTARQWADILGYFWREVFLDQAFVDAYSRSVAVSLEQLQLRVAELPGYSSRHRIPVFETEALRLYVVDETSAEVGATHYGDGTRYDGTTRYGGVLPKADTRRYAFDTVHRPRFLCTSVQGGTVLALGTDYVLGEGTITFTRNPLEIESLQKRAKLTGTATTYEFLFWGFQNETDIDAVSEYFGTIAGIVGPSSPWLFQAMNTAWDLRVEGATVKNVNRLLGLCADTAVPTVASTVVDVFPEGDRICVLTADEVLSAPATAGVRVVVGQSVGEAEPVFDSFIVRQGTDDIPFIDFAGLVLNPGYIPGTVGDLLFVNAETPVIQDGTRYSFFIGGQAADVLRFTTGLNPNFFDVLKQKYGRVPTTINPYAELKADYLRNTLFIKISLGGIRTREISQLLNVLGRTTPAGSSFFVILEKQVLEEGLGVGAGEDVAVFYAPDEIVEISGPVQEHVNTALVV